jgi:hypothetical protein
MSHRSAPSDLTDVYTVMLRDCELVLLHIYNNQIPGTLGSSEETHLLEFRLDATVFHPINSQLKHQIRALNLHVQFKIEVIELGPLSGSQTREKTSRDRIEVGSELAHIAQCLIEGIRWNLRVTSDKIIFNNE